MLRQLGRESNPRDAEGDVPRSLGGAGIAAATTAAKSLAAPG